MEDVVSPKTVKIVQDLLIILEFRRHGIPFPSTNAIFTSSSAAETFEQYVTSLTNIS